MESPESFFLTRYRKRSAARLVGVSSARPQRIRRSAEAIEPEATAIARGKKNNAPGPKTLDFALTVDPGIRAASWNPPAGYTEATAAKPAATTPAAAPTKAPEKTEPQGLGQFLLVAFGLGLAAIFTPCVFPMIPITVSFFLNQPSSGRIGQAVTFCLGIIVLFTGMGLALTAILGPFGVVQIGFAYLLFGFGVGHVQALEASLICLLEPVLNPLWVWLVLHERPSLWANIGGAIILGALTVRSILGERREARAALRAANS